MSTPSNRFRPLVRVRRTLAVFALLALFCTLAALDAQRTRGDDGLRAVERLGFVDLAMSSSARWLRAPSHAEQAAALSNGPVAFDTDPAGALIGPVSER